MRSSAGLNRPSLPKAGSWDQGEIQTQYSCSVERAGRDGHLFLDYTRCDHQTILSRYHFRNPLQVFPPIGLEGDGCAYTQVLNPTGGLVGGDRLNIQARLGAGTHVLLTTPSATRVYRSKGEMATQTTSLLVGPNAILEWMPDTVIPFAGSRFDQHLDVQLDRGATLLLWDAFSSGRVACGERWAFARLKNEILITTSEGGEALERYDLHPERVDLSSPALGEDWDYFASFYFISDRPMDWALLFERLAAILDRWPGRVFGGISSLAIPGRVLRLVAKTAVDLSATQAALWDTARRDLLGLEFPFLRKY